ncbi:MAG: nucleotidyl transferase AbiEii/AbiGii toxin family protein [Gammaproteobacteria bacterium]
MKHFDPTLFADIADFLNIASPAFVEKDYYAVQLLKTISSIKLPETKLIFAGGTCLTKVHLPTFRMSEDLDLKFLPNKNFFNLSNNKKRKYRSNYGDLVIKTIEDSHIFKLKNKESKSEGKYRCFHVSYPKMYKHDSLRPELKVEFTEIDSQYLSTIKSSIGSIYSSITKQLPEIHLLACDPIEMILIEKFLGLLRRVAEIHRGYSDNDDEALVRHIYDLYLIYPIIHDFSQIKKVFKLIVNQDVMQFGIRHAEFKYDPMKELLYGLNILTTDIKYKNRYKTFLGPLIYNANPPSWEQGMNTLHLLSKILLTKIY